MLQRSWVESFLEVQVAAFAASPDFGEIESGRAAHATYNRLIEAIFRAHIRSPKLVAFLYALAPPDETSTHLEHNLLEELGVEDEQGAHPDLLRVMLLEAGLAARADELIAEADADLRRYTVDPLLFGTLKEIGFSVLIEVVAFEYMLSRVSSRIATALQTHRGLSRDALSWFHHHSEVDILHAEQGIDNIVRYASWYGISETHALTIADMTFRQNIFIKRYFGEFAVARTL